MALGARGALGAVQDEIVLGNKKGPQSHCWGEREGPVSVPGEISLGMRAGHLR